MLALTCICICILIIYHHFLWRRKRAINKEESNDRKHKEMKNNIMCLDAHDILFYLPLCLYIYVNDIINREGKEKYSHSKMV